MSTLFADTTPYQWQSLIDQVSCPTWHLMLNSFSQSLQGQALLRRICQRQIDGALVFPPDPFAMLQATPFEQVRVIILGQDPYHRLGQAHGLAFSVPDGVQHPPSLRHILQEVQQEVGGDLPRSGNLLHWAQQGVLLLNTCLTVEASQPLVHAKWGWGDLTQTIIQYCSQYKKTCVFMLWGAYAQAYKKHIDSDKNLILCANHPSPLSARKPPIPFFGCNHFVQANQWLRRQAEKEVQWVKSF